MTLPDGRLLESGVEGRPHAAHSDVCLMANGPIVVHSLRASSTTNARTLCCRNAAHKCSLSHSSQLTPSCESASRR